MTQVFWQSIADDPGTVGLGLLFWGNVLLIWWIIHLRASRRPRPGQTCQIGGYTWRVLKYSPGIGVALERANGNGVTQCRVIPLDEFRRAQ